METLRFERDEMLQFLIQANFKLQEYDRERSNFLARSIHDLRAPLTAISGYCGLLLEEALGALTADQREVLCRMQQSAARLSRLTNSIVALSLRRRVSEELRMEQADLRECVEEALQQVSIFIERKALSIAVEMEPAPATLFFDKAQMQQTLVDLLDNACKFTPRDGRIEVRGYAWSGGLDDAMSENGERVEAPPESYRVDIRDGGPGIPAAEAARIFEENASYCGGQDRSGAGLGLAICKMVLQRHGGRIWTESNAAGATFAFLLPLKQRVGADAGRDCSVLSGAANERRS